MNNLNSFFIIPSKERKGKEYYLESSIYLKHRTSIRMIFVLYNYLSAVEMDSKYWKDFSKYIISEFIYEIR